VFGAARAITFIWAVISISASRFVCFNKIITRITIILSGFNRGSADRRQIRPGRFISGPSLRIKGGVLAGSGFILRSQVG